MIIEFIIRKYRDDAFTDDRETIYLYISHVLEKYFAGVHGTSIKSLVVPHIIRNGTGPVDLICIYEIDKDDNGLVIKWFHEAYLIYQWIPPSNLYF